MISSLRIENFALIDSVKIQFNSGFTVITGETGSGKSILLNALNLILGERANFSVIGNRAEKSTVEAEINIKDFGLEVFFEKHVLDYFDQTIVRREINKQGRSRAFINDTPVQLSVLKSFSSQLIHIHSQYNTLELKDVSFQLKVLDILAGTLELRNEFSSEVLDYKKLEQLLREKKKGLDAFILQADYNEFQLSELNRLDLDSIDYMRIQDAIQKGENSDEIKKGFHEIIEVLKMEAGVLDKLVDLKVSISKKISFDDDLKDLYERINSISIELDDCATEAAQKRDKIEIDPIELDEMTSQIDAFNHVLQKHRVQSQDELIAIRNELSSNFLSHEELVKDIEILEKEFLLKHSELKEKANKLHNERVKATEEITQDIKQELAGLKLENTELIFQLKQTEDFNATGNSTLEMLFSPNIGVAPVPVHQAASGGELSRVMLALQSLMSSKVKLRTMLFDEIDTGVSGDVAQKMGATLQRMGESMQVIAITHLPQVAAKGGQHLKVQKNTVDEKTLTNVVQLEKNESIEEIARLMSGNQINQAALENAKALMQ